MEKERLLSLILDSWNKPVVFVDTGHIIRYMNIPAIEHYSKWGDVIGKNILNCHNENSAKLISKAFSELEKGAEEFLFTDNQKHRVYMRGIRDEDGRLVGYCERYEPQAGK